MENQFSTGRCIWDKACKQTLGSISKAFSDEQNTNKTDSIDVKATFSAIAKRIQDFPIPEYPFPLPETEPQPGIYGLAEQMADEAFGSGTTHLYSERQELASKFNDMLMNHLLSSIKKGWSDDDMITFAEWYRMWYGHPTVGTNGYSALKCWKEAKKHHFTPIKYIDRSALEKGRDYFVVTEGGNIIQAHYSMITETAGDFFSKDTNEFCKVTQIDITNHKL